MIVLVLDAACLALILLLGLGLVRVIAGPAAADRILAIQLSGTTTVGLLLLLAIRLEQPALIHAALVFVLFAALLALGFVYGTERKP
ncbi:monovalent cation/H+ antiporter complex subunit F [Methylonatrum kenyense]|uniref:monovalent cation/H+ antiporter complex subunit F n=1 Tax=Methylonatrum kenyense TaxID=455253 RepID=UPI0020BDBFCF|nr:monovalent cation/H+ antiporter complex subunit F [Methylonatrum kenyense]